MNIKLYEGYRIKFIRRIAVSYDIKAGEVWTLIEEHPYEPDYWTIADQKTGKSTILNRETLLGLEATRIIPPLKPQGRKDYKRYKTKWKNRLYGSQKLE